MNNFYELFNITYTDSIEKIIMAYKKKINRYNNINKLSKEQIYDIKMLKTGLYILINPKLREKYNETLNKNITNDTLAIKSINEDALDTLDSLFNVDNSWMNNINVNKEQSAKKNNFETNIGDRVFSLSELNKRPGYSHDFDGELRKPLQGREDKSSEILNKN
jgi:hypothetical protein